MQYYFAPLEGLTDSVYRKLHHRYFPGIHRYYTPFFSPTIHRSFTRKEKRELEPADSLDFCVVPQVLTGNDRDFLWMAEQCMDAGYREINLNTGCPSGTVTAKGKGAGLLRDPDRLDRLLDAIFSATPIAVSVKTRIGFSDPEEFYTLLEIFNRYPIRELTVHPRTRSDFYNGNVDMEIFRYAVTHSKNPLCYNGNLCSRQQIDAFSSTFPEVHALMLGRGLIGDPGMLFPGGSTSELLEEFHNALLEQYTQVFGSSRNAMFRMKENWRYLHRLFEDSDKLYKRLRKTTELSEFISVTEQIFRTLPLRSALAPDW